MSKVQAVNIATNLVSNVAKSSGVSEADVAAVLNTLGLDMLSDRIAATLGSNLDIQKLGPLEVSARYDKMMISK